MADDQGWQGILDDGERILWQGRPSSRIDWLSGDWRHGLMGLFMTGFALFWMYQAARTGTAIWIFGLLFLIVGLREMLSETVLPAYIRSRTWYTLTNRRAIIATDMPVRGRRLSSVPITAQTPVALTPGDPGSVHFGPQALTDGGGEGFLLIPDATAVLRLIRTIQSSGPQDGSGPFGESPFAESTKDAP